MKSILVFRSCLLGDFVMSAPAFAEIRNVFPQYQVLLLSFQSANKSVRIKSADYVDSTSSSPWVELAMPHLIDLNISMRSASNLLYLLGLRQYLRSFKIEKVILMVDVGSPWIGRLKKLLLLRLLVGSVPILGWRGPSNPKQLKKAGTLKHHVHGPLQFLSEMTPPRHYNPEALIFDLRPGQESERWASDWMTNNSYFKGMKIMAVAPGSIQSHKRWPIESFEKVISFILVRYDNIRIVVIGTKKDSPLGAKLVNLDPRRVSNLAGLTTIAQSAALLQRCNLLLGNDGGAMHLGDAMGCKVVSIVPGIEYPDSIEPWHNKTFAVRHPVDCSPCYDFTMCPQHHNRCMTDLPAGRVIEICTSLLDQ
jgi:heptosyltransferase-2